MRNSDARPVNAKAGIHLRNVELLHRLLLEQGIPLVKKVKGLYVPRKPLYAPLRKFFSLHADKKGIILTKNLDVFRLYIGCQNIVEPYTKNKLIYYKGFGDSIFSKKSVTLYSPDSHKECNNIIVSEKQPDTNSKTFSKYNLYIVTDLKNMITLYNIIILFSFSNTLIFIDSHYTLKLPDLNEIKLKLQKYAVVGFSNIDSHQPMGKFQYPNINTLEVKEELNGDRVMDVCNNSFSVNKDTLQKYPLLIGIAYPIIEWCYRLYVHDLLLYVMEVTSNNVEYIPTFTKNEITAFLNLIKLQSLKLPEKTVGVIREDVTTANAVITTTNPLQDLNIHAIDDTPPEKCLPANLNTAKLKIPPKFKNYLPSYLFE